MKQIFLLLLLAAIPASAAAPSNVQLIANGLKWIGPERLVKIGNPSLIEIAKFDLNSPAGLAKLATMGQALSRTDRELLRQQLAAEPRNANELAWLFIGVAQGAERYSNTQEQRLAAALETGTISPRQAARELRLADSLQDSPHLSASSNARLARSRAQLAALAAQPAQFDNGR